jgi:predicted O-methyltransferase YrrM
MVVSRSMISQHWRARLEGAADLCGRGYIRLVRTARGLRPVAVEHWYLVARLFNRIFRTEDSMYSKTFFVSGASRIRSREVRELLHDCQVGGWSLDAGTFDLLWSLLQQSKPQTLMEFGSGLSTMVLAAYSRSAKQPKQPSVWSIEQDEGALEQTRTRLRSAGLESYVRLVHAPLTSDSTYALGEEWLSRELSGRQVDLVLIDGPKGRAGCREAVLGQAAPFCRPGAVWVLDDAFSDCQLEILTAWKRMPGIKVFGIYPIGKGFGAGVIGASTS